MNVLVCAHNGQNTPEFRSPISRRSQSELWSTTHERGSAGYRAGTVDCDWIPDFEQFCVARERHQASVALSDRQFITSQQPSRAHTIPYPIRSFQIALCGPTNSQLKKTNRAMREASGDLCCNGTFSNIREAGTRKFNRRHDTIEPNKKNTGLKHYRC